MTVDQYAICPCGNGKKIKFCKCKESLPELDRISTMLEGGQIIPALDRINRILDEHPDAAWALAIKGRVLLNLREYKTLAENADRFVRLQPTNPLALTQRAAAQLFDNQLTAATESILEALAESGANVDSFVLDIISVLAFSLANAGHYLSARAYSTLALTAEGFEGSRNALHVLQELNGSTTVNRLLKALPENRNRPDDVDWAERFDEALGLLRSNRIALAETKFASLARSYPNQPAILSGLLSCAVWQANLAAQADCFAKLSRCEQLDDVERSKQLALSYVVDPDHSPASVPVYEWVAEVDDILRIELALQADSRYVQLPEQFMRNFVTNDDDVPPRSAFQLLDGELPDADAPLEGDKLPIAIAMVSLFGKQTDRAARVVVPAVLPHQFDTVRSGLSAVIGEMNWAQTELHRVPFTVAGEAQPPVLSQHDKPGLLESVYRAFREAKLANQLLTLQLPALGDRSLQAVAGDSSLLLQREAILRVLENADKIAENTHILEAVRQGAGLSALASLLPRSAEDVEEVDNSDLARVDPSGLDEEGLAYLLHRGQSLNMRSLIQRVGQTILDRDLSDENQPLKSAAFVALIETAATADESLELSNQAKQHCDQNGLDKAQFLLMEIPALVRKGDPDALQNLINKLMTDYRNRQDVMGSLHQMLYSFGFINADGTPRMTTAPPPASTAASHSAIWTPDGGAAPSEPAGQSGGSKLWVPGMD